MRRITFILGGARSGKSRFAEGLARGLKGKPAYIATAEIIDEEMCERILRHRAERGPKWRTIEAPVDLVPALQAADAAKGFTLVECLSVWINNLMYHGKDVASEVEKLCAGLSGAKGHIVIVSNEVGLGIVPDNALARRFRDEAGRAHQALAQIADEVVFIAAGLPMTLKKTKLARKRARPRAKGRGRRG